MGGNLPHQVRRYRFVIAGLIVAAHLCVGLNVFAVSPVLPIIIEDYGITSTAASLLVALALLAAAFGLPGGLIVMRLGLKPAFTIAWVSMGLLVLSAVAPNYPALLVLRLLLGLGSALVLTATGPLLVTWFQPREVVLMNGLNTAVFSLGIALSVWTMVPLAEVIGWRFALTAFGGVGVVGTFAWIALGRETREAGAEPEKISVRQIPAVLNRSPILLLLAADAGVLVQYTALSAWLPNFYAESRGMTLSQAGFLTGLLPFVGIFGVLLGATLPLRIHSPRPFLVVPGVMVILGGLGSFGLDNVLATYAGLVLLGLGSWLYVPTLLALSISLVDGVPGQVAIVWGALITFSGFAMFASPVLVGFLRDVWGSFFPGFLISSVAAWMLLITGLFISMGAPKRQTQAEKA